MMEYTVWNPGGNVTVFGSLSAGADPAEWGLALLKAEPRAEQAGFLRHDLPDCDVRLDMAGGEFCGNATLSSAAECAMNEGQAVGSRKTVLVSCSGYDRIISVELTRESETRFRGSLRMPEPLGLTDCHGYPAVLLPGIAHVIVEGPEGSPDPETVIRDWCTELGAEALGILFFDRKTCSLIPYVFVKKLGCIYRENACASGSCAVGFYLAKEAGTEVSALLKQPAGTIRIGARPDGTVVLEGSSEYLYRKRL